jgi:uncharacterized membrane-anchored protein
MFGHSTYRRTRSANRFALWVVTLVAGIVLPVSNVLAQGAPESAEQQHARQVAASLHWMTDGASQPVASVAQLRAPAGYVMLNPGDTAKLMELMHNVSDGTSEYYLAPASEKWFAIFSYDAVGYVKDDEKVDADAVLQSIKTGTEQGNEERKRRGWAPMTIRGWAFPPRYDMSTKRLEWAVDAVADGQGVANYNTRILGRQGVTKVTLVADPQDLTQAVSEFNQAITNFSYVGGERYDEFKPGDKVAEYGLAALIAGGAAAVATKTGFWKVLVGFLAAGWKVIVAVVIAGLAGLRGLFKRKAR